MGTYLTLSQLIVMVRELQIDPSGVNIQLVAADVWGHGRALDVPAGAAEAPRRRPRRLAALTALPEGEVVRWPLLGCVVW